MTKLSTFSDYLETYLKIHGDKEVLSVATRHGDKNCDFVVNMADLYDGPIGSNPYKGRDELPIPAGVVNDDIIFVEEEKTTYEEGVDDGYEQGYEEGYEYGRSTANDESASTIRFMKKLFVIELALSILSLALRSKKK